MEAEPKTPPMPPLPKKRERENEGYKVTVAGEECPNCGEIGCRDCDDLFHAHDTNDGQKPEIVTLASKKEKKEEKEASPDLDDGVFSQEND